MKKRLPALLLSAAVVSGVGTLAQAAPEIGAVDDSAAADAAQSSPALTTLRVRGTIEQYDASSRILSLTTAKGTVQFAVAEAARVNLRGRKVDASALKNLSGYSAAVRYWESSGNKTVESVSVFERAKG